MRYNWLNIFLIVIIFNGCERKVNPVQPNDGVPPAVPTQLTVYYLQDGAVGIEWKPNSEPDLNGYNIYRKTNSSSFSFLAFTKNFYYANDSLSYNDTYYYKISAIDDGGLESQLSTEVSATPVNKNPPKKPTGLLINARNWEGKISVHLEWNKNQESDVAEYKVYRDTVQNFTLDSTKIVGHSSNIEYSDTTNVKLYKDYYYRIKAIDKGGLQSPQSDEVSDQVYGMPELIFPANDSYHKYFSDFKIKTIGKPASYQVIVQDNKFFGDFWSKKFTSSVISDTISVSFDPVYLSNATYYWRVVTYSGNNDSPNSISEQYHFTIN
ncbi:MAG: hypothetical protein WB996_11150 [Ignavibacteriaceae bacterium]